MDLEREVFKAGDWVVYPEHGRLSRAADSRTLDTEAARLLLYLAEHAGESVSRSAIAEHVWGRTDVDQATIDSTLASLREALDDDASAPRYIATEPDGGLRLLCAVRPVERAASSPLKRSFIGELDRRGVFRSAMAYGVVAWLVLQVAEVTFEPFGIPIWVMRMMIVLVVTGFPVAMILSWTFDINSQGIVRDPHASEPGPARRPVLNGVLLVVLLAALGSLLSVQMSRRPDGTGEANDRQRVVRDGDEGDAASAPARESLTASTSDAPPVIPEDLTDGVSIAVLPFENHSEYPENAFFADGLAEEMLVVLSRVPWLDVASRTSTFYYRDKDVDLETIAARLHVRYVMEGSVRRYDEKIRVTAQLIDSDTGFHTWGATYDRDLAELLVVQSEIATAVVNAVEPQLAAQRTDAEAVPASAEPATESELTETLPEPTSPSGPVASRTGLAGELPAQALSPDAPGTPMPAPSQDLKIDYRPTENIEAYVFYLQARDYLRRPDTAVTLDSAEGLFRRAIALDGKYAQAFAGLCETHLLKYGLTSDSASVTAAEAACRRALVLDDSLAEVKLSLGALYRVSGEYERSKQVLRELVQTAPSATVMMDLGYTYVALNDLDSAEAAFRRALQIEPGSWVAYNELGNFLYDQGRYGEAATCWKQVTALTPDNAGGFNNLAVAHYMLDDFAPAAQAWERSLQLEPTALTYTNLGLSYYYLGRFDEAAKMQLKAIALTPKDHLVWGRLAESYRYVKGEREASEEAYAEAAALAEVDLKLNPKDWDTTAHLALYRAHQDQRDEARKLIAEAHRLSPDNPDLYYFEALVANELGDRNGTFNALQRALALGFSDQLVTQDPDLNPLITSSRMQALLRRGGAAANH